MDITNLINNNNNNNFNNDKDSMTFEFPNQFIIVQPSFNHYQYNQHHQQQEYQNNYNNNNCSYYSENTSDDETYNSDDSSVEFIHCPIPSSPSMISENCVAAMPTTPSKSTTNQVNYVFHNLFINEGNKHLFHSYFSKNHYKKNEELLRSN